MARRYDSRSRRWRSVPVVDRTIVYTNEGTLNFTTEEMPWMEEGRRRGAFLSGHMISDAELELRLAKHARDVA